MATDTSPSIPQARRNPRQVLNTLKKTVNFGDTGIATGIAFDEALPMGAFITGVFVDVVTAFNAAGVNTLTVGTNSTSYNNLVASADLSGNGTASIAAVATQVLRGIGRSIAAAAEKVPYVKYTQTSTAATTGQAVVVITYEGGWST